MDSDNEQEAIFMKIDREYFEAHPDAKSYTRLNTSDELVPTGWADLPTLCLHPGQVQVVVTQIALGVRARSFPDMSWIVLSNDMIDVDATAAHYAYNEEKGSFSDSVYAMWAIVESQLRGTRT